VVIWDRQTGASKVLNIPAKFGAGVYLHSMEMDNSGQYIRLGGITQAFGTVFWHWQDDVFSTSVTLPAPDYFGGHKVQGAGVILNQGMYGDAWLIRSMRTPHMFSPALTYPRKNGKVNWFEDSHASRMLSDGTFFESRYVAAGYRGKFARTGPGSVYQRAGYLRANGVSVDAPEIVRYKGVDLPLVSEVPAGPGQWSYDGVKDTLRIWLPDSSDPEAGREFLRIIDWRPMMEEIIQILKDGSGAWTWRRLAHHRSHYTGWENGPRGNVDPTGSFVLFQSSWDGTLRNAGDGSARVDVFMLIVPPLPRPVGGR